MSANELKIYQFKVKDFEIKSYSFCLDNIWKDFTVDNMTKSALNRYVYGFSVD